jgi:transposase
LTIEGYLDYIIFQGSITTEIFNDFVEDRVLPHCNPYPSPRSVLILDNASIHKNIRLRELCNKQGVKLEFLPPYSPDFNPIEATFKDLKAWIKRNYKLAEDFEDFGDFLHFTVNECRGFNAQQHFKEAGYVVRDLLCN